MYYLRIVLVTGEVLDFPELSHSDKDRLKELAEIAIRRSYIDTGNQIINTQNIVKIEICIKEEP